MLRVLSATGLTASANLVQPNVGYKWRIISVQIQISTGTGTGDRSASIWIVGKGSLFNYPMLAYTGTQTGTSSVFSGSGSATPAVGGVTNTEWKANPEMRAADEIYFDLTLISGDTASYYVLVDEVLDE